MEREDATTTSLVPPKTSSVSCHVLAENVCIFPFCHGPWVKRAFSPYTLNLNSYIFWISNIKWRFLSGLVLSPEYKRCFVFFVFLHVMIILYVCICSIWKKIQNTEACTVCTQPVARCPVKQLRIRDRAPKIRTTPTDHQSRYYLLLCTLC